MDWSSKEATTNGLAGGGVVTSRAAGVDGPFELAALGGEGGNGEVWVVGNQGSCCTLDLRDLVGGSDDGVAAQGWWWEQRSERCPLMKGDRG